MPHASPPDSQPTGRGPAGAGKPRPSYLSGTSQVPLLGLTIGDYFDAIVEQHGDREALVVCRQRVRWTYRQLAAEVDRCARGLLALGVEKGDRIGIWAPNRAEWPVVQFAAAKIGALLVNINPAYRVFELEYVVRQSGVRVLIYAPRLHRSDYQAMLQELIPELAGRPPRGEELSVPSLPELKHLLTLAQVPVGGAWSWTDLPDLARGVSPAQLRERQCKLEFDDPINIQYTSGTTGSPKGATLTHHNLLNNGYFVAARMGFTPEDRLCIPVPLYHCFGTVMGNLACMAHGAAMVYPAETFDPGATLAAVEAERCTALHGVPTMFIAELNHPEFDRFDLSSLRTGIMAGSPCPIEVMRQVYHRMHLRHVEIAYGMTETSPVSFQTLMEDPLEKRVGTVGTIMPHLECKIVHPATGRIVPEGTAGELCTRGHTVMRGYWNDPEATAAVLDAAGWMHSGDLAVLRDGYVNIVGRIKDMIIRGGENISPREIEEFLHTHPAIADVYVIAVPSRTHGEDIMAWVKPAAGECLTAEQIREYCRNRISHFKIPRYVKLVDSFPMTVTGKVQKYVMRSQAIEELGLAAEIVETA